MTNTSSLSPDGLGYSNVLLGVPLAVEMMPAVNIIFTTAKLTK